MKPPQVFMAAACILLTVITVSAQRDLSPSSPVIENFDSLGTSSLLVTDNVTITGFYTRKSSDADGNPSANTVLAGSGTSSTSDLYHFGVAGTNPVTDRAFGGIPGGAGVGNISFGLRLANTGSVPISSISLGYTGEHWRDGNGTNTITVDYRVSSTAITDLTSGTYTAVPSLTYTPLNPSGTGNLDGNAPANRQVFAPTNILLSSPLQPGHEIMIRWTLLDSSGPDHGVAIDDVFIGAIAPTAAAVSVSGRVTDAYGRALRGAIITVSDFAGGSQSVLTNTFGYYKVTGLEAGQSYVVGVSARRYTFATASQLVSLDDNLDGLDFVALP